MATTPVRRDNVPTQRSPEDLEDKSALLQQKIKEGEAFGKRGDFTSAIRLFNEVLDLAIETKDKAQQANTYDLLAISYMNMGQKEKVIEVQEKRLTIAQELKAPRIQADAYGCMSEAYSGMGNLSKAKEMLSFGLTIARESGENKMVAKLLIGGANMALKEGQFESAVDNCNKAIEISTESNDVYFRSQALGLKGKALQTLGKYPDALATAMEGLKVAEAIGNNRTMARCYGVAGGCQMSLGKLAEASESFSKCLQSSKAVGDLFGMMGAYNNIGLVFNEKGEFLEAIKYFGISLQFSARLQSADGMSSAYNNMGAAYHSLQDSASAIKCYEQSCLVAKKTHNKLAQARGFGNIGLVLHDQGDYLRALNHFEKQQAVGDEINHDETRAIALLNKGNTLTSLGQYSSAVESYEMAKELNAKMGRKRGVVNTLGALGNAYYALGNYERSIELLSQCVEQSQEIGDKHGVGVAYANLGNSYQAIGESEKSVELLSKCIEIAEETGDKKMLAEATGNIANAFHALGDIEKAIEMRERGIRIDEELGSLSGLAFGYGALGSLLFFKGEKQRAVEYIEKSLEIAKKLGEKELEGKCYTNLGTAQGRMGNFEIAEECFRKAVRILGEIQSSLAREEWKITILEEQSRAYTQLEILHTIQKKHDDALLIAEIRRSRALADSIHQAIGRSVPNDVAVHALSLQEIREASKAHNTHLLVFSLAPLREGNIIANLWVVTPDGEIRFQQIPLDSLANDVKGLEGLMKDGPLRGGAEHVRSIAPLGEVEELTRGQRNPAAAKAKAFRKKLQAWHAALIAPIKEFLPPEGKLTIIPDGFLSQLPFGIFMDEEGKYLIEDYTVSIAPSVQVLKLLLERKVTAEPAEGALIVGNPTPGVEAAELPMAEQEAMRLKELLGVPDGRTLIKGDAQVGAVKATMKEAKIVHFACHGEPGLKTNVHSVFEGAFLMSPDEDHKKGLLYAEEIGKLDLKADLVFLSACHSGKGAIKREGVIGHMRSFLAAGASSVVGTLWSLPDSELTVDMVTGFYERVLEGMPKDEALREVMLMAIERKRNSPHAWGAFVLTGLAN